MSEWMMGSKCYDLSGLVLSERGILNDALKLREQERRRIRYAAWAENSIQSLPRELLFLFPRMTKLHLSWNRLLLLPKCLVQAMPRLEELLLGHNNLQRLPSVLTRLTSLRTLSLLGNPCLPYSVTSHLAYDAHSTAQRGLSCIADYYAPVEVLEECCRRTIVCLLGLRKFRPASTVAYCTDKNILDNVAKALWETRGNARWYPWERPDDKRQKRK